MLDDARDYSPARATEKPWTAKAQRDQEEFTTEAQRSRRSDSCSLLSLSKRCAQSCRSVFSVSPWSTLIA